MAADIDAVIDVFSAQRLLVLGEDSVEIAHDALLHAWRLATVDTAAARWQGAPARYLPLPATSQAFLGAAHHAASRGTLRRRAVIAGLLALTVIAVSAAGIAVNAAADASRQAANASRQHAIALSRELAAESLAADSANPLTARRLAVAAWRVFPTGQAGSALASLLMEQQQRGILHGNPANAGVRVVSFSPDGKLLAASYGDGTVRLWNPATQQAVGAPFPAATGPGGACSAWRSARTASCWPPPAPTAPCGPGRCRFSPIRTQRCVPMSGRRQRQSGRTTPRVNSSPASAGDTCRFPPAPV
jgi:hypothetical protein